MNKMPMCDMCKTEGKNTEAKYDSKTVMGPFAYLCEEHFKTHGSSIATKLEKRVKIALKTSKVPTVTIPLSLESVIDIHCPHCRESRMVEPDANYIVTCECCNNKYRVISQI